MHIHAHSAMHIPFSCQHLSSSAPLFCSPVLRNFLKYLPILTVSTFSSPLDSNPFQSKFMLATTKLFSSELPTISTVVSVRTFLLPYLIWTLRSTGHSWPVSPSWNIWFPKHQNLLAFFLHVWLFFFSLVCQFFVPVLLHVTNTQHILPKSSSLSSKFSLFPETS